MRKVVLGIGLSLDGYIARADGAVDFLFMPKDYSMAGFFKRIDVAVMGRKSYEAALALGGSMSSPGIQSYVFSKTLKTGMRPEMTVVQGSPKEFVATIRKKKGKDIWLMGGGELARAFLQEDQVDELYLGILPVLIGEGIRAFPEGFPDREFKLTENRTYSKGLVTLRYARVRKNRAASKPATPRKRKK
jgi:dihydrofolate reductase